MYKKHTHSYSISVTASPMELCASRAISHLPVFSTLPAGSPLLPPNHAIPFKTAIASPSARSFNFRFRHFSTSLLRAAAASDDSDGFSPLFTEKRDGVTVFEEPKQEPLEVAQEQAFQLFKDLSLESVGAYSVALYGSGAFFGLWLVSAIVGAVDSVPLVSKFLEVVGLGYTVWFTARFLLFKESREELAAKIDEVKEQVIG